MKIAVHYHALYQYAESASFSPHVVRLFPRQDFHLEVRRTAFSTHPSADVSYRHDLFGNLIAHCFYPQPLDQLDFRLELDIALEERNPFHFLLDSHALRIPFDYLPEEKAILQPLLTPRQETGPLPAPLRRPLSPRPTVEALATINHWLHENIEYERREEGDPYPPAETLRLQKGSCRDFAVLLAEVLRQHGIATRLASGFLYEDDSPDSPHRAENALHAWIEACLPGAGWIGMDPTNGVFCDHHFLTAAIGATPRDIAPVLGNYYGKKTIASSLQTGLTISRTE